MLYRICHFVFSCGRLIDLFIIIITSSINLQLFYRNASTKLLFPYTEVDLVWLNYIFLFVYLVCYLSNQTVILIMCCWNGKVLKKKYQMYTFQFIKQECIDQNNNRIYEIIHFSSHQQKRSTIQFLNSRMMSCFIWTHILNIYIVLLLFFSLSVSYMLNGIKCG